MKKIWLFVFISFYSLAGFSQSQPKKIFHDDSLNPVHKYLPDITVVGRNSKSDYQQLPEIVGTNIYAGKKMR